MAFEVWLSFILASMVLCFTPGPTVFIVMGQSLNHGKKSVIPLVSGVLVGDVIAMSISFLGLGALLATSASLFSLFKWLAACYLVYLGIKAWHSKVEINNDAIESNNMKKGKSFTIFKEAMIVTALNPKGIIFFIAFFPLFIDTNRPAMTQMLVMALSFMFVSAFSASTYSIFAGYLRSKVKSITFQRRLNKTSGGMLIGAGLVTSSIQATK